MIKFENTEVTGWEAAIRGMRNPMNSWNKSDSFFHDTADDYYEGYHNLDGTGFNGVPDHADPVFIGFNDFKIMKSLVRAGSDHSKFMRMINVTVDITAPMYWWKEFDTYKVGTVRNSCSTMHKIHDKEFTADDFSFEHLSELDGVNGKPFCEDTLTNIDTKWFSGLILHTLNKARKLYIQTKDKRYWWCMIQLLPSSYNQRSTVQLNYAVLRYIYHSRKNHKLDEWSVDFCNWVKTLPYSELITDDFKGAIMNIDKVDYGALNK